MKLRDYLLPGILTGAKHVPKLKGRIDDLKRQLGEVKQSRDEFKERAHAAEESLRQTRRALEIDPHRCRYFLDKAVSELSPELAGFAGRFGDVSVVIDIEDDMIWSSTSELYFGCGVDAMRIIARAVDQSLGRTPQRILDLPCGHGRVMRWLRQAYPQAVLAGCDTQEHGMQFCEEHFGSHSIIPAAKPSEMTASEKFDLIWIGSLFTHLPEAEFVAFLGHLPNLLSDGGVVVFTTHGEKAMERLRGGDDFHLQDVDVAQVEKRYREGGFAFESYKKHPDYGVSFSAPAWIRRHLEGVVEFEIGAIAEDVWSGLQDVCVCRKKS